MSLVMSSDLTFRGDSFWNICTGCCCSDFHILGIKEALELVQWYLNGACIRWGFNINLHNACNMFFVTCTYCFHKSIYSIVFSIILCIIFNFVVIITWCFIGTIMAMFLRSLRLLFGLCDKMNKLRNILLKWSFE